MASVLFASRVPVVKVHAADIYLAVLGPVARLLPTPTHLPVLHRTRITLLLLFSGSTATPLLFLLRAAIPSLLRCPLAVPRTIRLPVATPHTAGGAAASVLVPALSRPVPLPVCLPLPVPVTGSLVAGPVGV